MKGSLKVPAGNHRQIEFINFKCPSSAIEISECREMSQNLDDLDSRDVESGLLRAADNLEQDVFLLIYYLFYLSNRICILCVTHLSVGEVILSDVEVYLSCIILNEYAKTSR